MDKLSEAKKVFDTEMDAVRKLRDSLDESFLNILQVIVQCKGKVIVTGIGKPGHIAAKMAATFASLGIPSFHLHPAEAMHGDLGMVEDSDVVIAISYSGESDEVIRIIPNIKMIGATLIAVTGNPDSTLSKTADYVQVLPKFQEACHLGLAPTSSTTAALCYGDALAVTASKMRGFKTEDFGKFHPAGSLGKKLILRVGDIMARGDEIPAVGMEARLMDAIEEMSSKGLGLVSITDSEGRLAGIITDGDLRRIIEKRLDIYTVTVSTVMVKNPKTCGEGALAVDALRFIKQESINNLPVTDEQGRLTGSITWQMIVKAGIFV